MTKKTPTTNQFREVQTPSGKKAFEAYCAVNINSGNHVAICSPSMQQLEQAWRRLFGDMELVRESVQHVWIVRAET